ncbi:MAG TPA: tetratricopeptide repeat protein [Thermoanaerobaculia bacterium]|nr:tetratricopeptide repeat protein [Thermoanaerobaculia bacterium]
MTTYPGNQSLPSETRERVLATFKQTVDLHKQGRSEEARTGCDFVLKLDPTFEPARRLLQKISDPSADIDVDSLLQSSEPGDRLARAREALDARDFQQAINISTEVLTEDFFNEEASRIAGDAREKLEAAPFVDQFLMKATGKLSEGNHEAARTLLEKARSLDADHPAVKRFESQVPRSAASAASSSPIPSFTPEASWVSEAPITPITTSRELDFNSGQSSSFVVDTGSAASSSASKPSDFEFTFEEEAPAPAASSAFSFDPAPPQATGNPFLDGFGAAQAPSGFDASSFGSSPVAQTTESGAFDFGGASVETSPEDQTRIARYLEDGDRAFKTGDFQEAIDIWSRIFLIDVTNETASERIENAKRKRQAVEGRNEELITEGVAAYMRRDLEAAKRRFDEVLTTDAGNVTASDYLRKIDVARSSPDQSSASFPETSSSSDSLAGFDDFPAEDQGAGGMLMPPDPEPAASPGAGKGKGTTPPVATSTSRSSWKTPLMIGALVLFLAAASYFAYTRFFSGEQAETAIESQTALREAQSLSKRGQYDRAIALLLTIQPGDQYHDQAIEMLADLKKKKGEAASMINGRPAGDVFAELLVSARAAVDSFDFVAAKKMYEEASAIRPLPPEAKPFYDNASQQVAKLDNAMVLFKEGKYRDALLVLDGLSKENPQNQNIRQLLVNAHFNIGKGALESENMQEAAASFDEVLKANPQDELARRSRELVKRYEKEPKDLLYRIYAKYLPLR